LKKIRYFFLANIPAKDLKETKQEPNRRNSSMVEKEKSKPVKPKATADRLLEDKMYLMLLSNGIGKRTDIRVDGTNRMVQVTAHQALDFLKSRETFWDQLDLGLEQRQAKSSSSKALKSYRWIM